MLLILVSRGCAELKATLIVKWWMKSSGVVENEITETKGRDETEERFFPLSPTYQWI